METRASSEVAAWLLDGGRARMDLDARHLLVAGVPAKLGGRAFDLLQVLVEHRDRVVPKQELLDLVWPGLVVEENNLQVHVLTLRKRLGTQAITTVAGRGYRFALAVQPVLGSAIDSVEYFSAGPLSTPEDTHSPAQARPAPTPAVRRQGLIGRGALLNTLQAQLVNEKVRLLTLSGPGGSGKTRLALHAAARLAPAMADGAYVVMLAPVRDAAHVMTAIAAALGLQENGADSLATLVHGFLQKRQVLLVLDNLEHLPQAVAQVSALLAAAPRLQVLATSRVLLHLAQELEVKVPPLSLPRGDAPADLSDSAALQLFSQRAAALGHPLPDMHHQPAQWLAAAQICRRLDGLPLAIELAVARLRVLTPTALTARLQQSLPFLTGGAADAPQRHQTLRDTIAWSHELLEATVQRLFRRLGVFAGGWSVEAAEAVDGVGQAASTLDELAVLLDHNLVQRVDDLEGEPRYSMLETIREFALEKLALSGEAHGVRQRHAAHFLALAMQGERGLTSAGRMPWLARLRADSSNLRVALQWLAGEAPQTQPALQLAAAMTWLWYFEGAYREGIRELTHVLGLSGAEDFRFERATVLSGVTRLASFAGEMALAHRAARDSIAIWREGADRPGAARGLGFALLNDGVPSLFAAGCDAAVAALDEASDCFRRASDPWGVALATVYRGVVLAVRPGAEEEAMPWLTEGHEQCLALGDDWAASTCSGYLGLVAMRRGDYAVARQRMEHILASARDTGDRFRIGRSAHFLGELELLQQRWRDAHALLVEALELVVEQGRQGDFPLMLCCVARALTGLDRHADAVRLFAVGTRPVAVKPTLPPDDPAKVEAALQICRVALGAPGFEAAWLEGTRMDLQAALKLALVSGSWPAAPAAPQTPAPA